MISRVGYLTSSVWAHLCKHGAPASCLFGTLEWPSYDGPKYIMDLAYHWDKRGSRKRTRHKMVMDQIPRRTSMGERPHFLLTPTSTSVASAVDLASKD
jgi:hypothetical protein